MTWTKCYRLIRPSYNAGVLVTKKVTNASRLENLEQG